MLAKNLKLILILGCVIGGALTGIMIVLLMTAGGGASGPPAQQNININKSTKLTFESDPAPAKELKEPQMPNITATLQSIDGFVAENLTAYVGEDQIPDFGLLTHVRIVLDWIYIYNDHDPLPGDSGEIEVQTYSMIYQSGGELFVEHAINRIFIANLNDGDNYTTDIVLFDGWVWKSYIILEIFDEDTMDFDDHLGFWWHFWDNSAWRFAQDLVFYDYTAGDARIGIYQEVLGTRNTTSADVVNLMRPYLFTDVETSMGLNLEDIYGRVVYGTDSLLEKKVYCIQYFFYWSAEYTAFDSFVHFWDYEPLYYFIDPLTSDRPYRIVYDNGFYWSGVSGGDEQWWKCHKYTIYEDLTLTGQTAGVELFNVNFNHDIAPLIGDSNQLEFTIKSINEIFDGMLQNWVYGVGGFDVPVITVETSYHSFDYGDSDGGINWDFDYAVDNLTDSTIFTWFERLNISFYGGTHSVDFQETPYYSPFCYDIMNPFQRPYISNNFDKLLADINAFNNAKESKSFSYELYSDIKATLNVPVDATITTPNSVGANETFKPNVTVNINAEHATLTVDYTLGFSVDVDWCFWEGSYDFIKNGTIFIDFSNPILQLIGTYVKNSAGFQVSYSPTSYIQIDMDFTPQLLGPILNVTVRFKVLELLYNYLPQLRVLMLFIEGFDFIINPILEGVLNMDSWATGAPHTHHTFSTLSLSFSPTITTPTDHSGVSIWLGNFSYGWRFYADWRLEIDFTSLLEIFFNDIYYNVFTFPDLNIILFPFGTDLSLCTYQWNPSFEKYILV